MDPALQQQLAEYLKQLQSGGQFVIDQAPLVVQEALLYARVINTLGFVLAACLCVGGVVFLLKPRGGEDDLDWEDNPFPFIAAVVVAVFGAIASVSCAIDGIKAWLAPRVYIIEWVGGLL